jgi:alanine racemase
MITASISGQNLLHNIATLQNLAPKSKLVIMFKANAYGHGIYEVAKYLETHIQNNFYALGVARIDEAILLRNAGIKIPILLAEGVFREDELLIAAEQNFWVTFHNSLQLSWLQNSNLPNKINNKINAPKINAKKINAKKINAWLKLNTGMNRLGFDLQEAKNAYQILSNHPNIIKPITIFSHFACADDFEHPLNSSQINQFQKFTDGLPVLRSLNNSAGIVNFPQTNYDIVRAGISVYGASPAQSKSSSVLNLKPVMTLQTQIIAIHNLSKGQSVGYGTRFKCDRDKKIGVAAIGYGDGYSRTIKDGAPILVNGVKCSIAGRVSMDMITIDLENYLNAKIGDSVTLWGDGLPIDEVAKFSSCVSYDLFCGIQNRVKYVWN